MFLLNLARERREVLRGTFYLASLMAHSCVVNVQLSFRNDTTMVVKSTVPIEEGEGIFVSSHNLYIKKTTKIQIFHTYFLFSNVLG